MTENKRPKLSVAIPYHSTPQTAMFLERLMYSISQQSFTDYEIVLTQDGGMARNHNTAARQAKGDIIKFMSMDDYFTHANALEDIIEAMSLAPWLVSGSSNNPEPKWTDDVYKGNNKLGGLSSIAVRRDCFIPFEEPLSWMIDCDWYYRMYLKYGTPTILNGNHVTIDEGTHSSTHQLAQEQKASEVYYVTAKYGNT